MSLVRIGSYLVSYYPVEYQPGKLKISEFGCLNYIQNHLSSCHRLQT